MVRFEGFIIAALLLLSSCSVKKSGITLGGGGQDPGFLCSNATPIIHQESQRPGDQDHQESETAFKEIEHNGQTVRESNGKNPALQSVNAVPEKRVKLKEIKKAVRALQNPDSAPADDDRAARIGCVAVLVLVTVLTVLLLGRTLISAGTLGYVALISLVLIMAIMAVMIMVMPLE